MNDVLLINRINPEDDIRRSVKISIVIADMQNEAVCEKIIETIERSGCASSEDLTIKYNGVVLALDVANIPKIINDLSKAGLQLYGVYELYDK